MPYPSIYDVTYSYTGFQQSQGDNSFPGTQIDADFAGLVASLDDLDAFMQSVIRSDGALNNGIVSFDSLSPSLQTAGLSPAAAWLTATFYPVGKNALFNGSLYRALIAHTSGVFATDLAAVKWLFVAALPAGIGDLQAVNNLSELTASSATARTNLGLGTAATKALAFFAQVANNLSDLANAATARTNLGLGTAAVQASGFFAQVANNLSDLANATTARGNLGLGTAAVQATAFFAQVANNLSDVASAVTARANLGLAIGTNVQAFDAQLFSNIPQNSKSAAYTTLLTDAQKHILHPSADTTARIFTIDSNANVAYPIGTAITFVNQNGAGIITIAITTDTMRLAGSGATGSRTLAANGTATALKLTATEWLISGTGLT